MAENEQSPDQGDNPFIDVWVKGLTDFWSQVVSGWSSSPLGDDTGAEGESGPEFQSQWSRGAFERIQGTWRLAAKATQAVLTSLQDPQALEGLMGGAQLAPQIGLQMARVWWDSYNQLYQQWTDKVANLTTRTEAYDFDDLDQEHFRAWADIYEKEFRQYLHLPQLGLARTYQEKVNQVVDCLNVLQGKMAEFLFLLYVPLEKSLKYMQQKLEEEYDDGGLPDNFKDYYQAWLKVLEGHYMTLFTSPEYVTALAETLSTMEDFTAVKQSFLEDLFKALPVPTHKEMDEVYRELYLLKKEVRRLKRDAK